MNTTGNTGTRTVEREQIGILEPIKLSSQHGGKLYGFSTIDRKQAIEAF